MIAVDKIRIQGFRGIASLEMRLERTTVLIGPNNCGKTSVLKALQLALSDEHSADGHDFHRAADGTVATEILIDVRFIPVSEAGLRRRRFAPVWAEALKDCIRHDRRDSFAFRTRIAPGPGGTIEKTRHLLLNWDGGAVGRELTEPLPFIRMCLLEAEDDLQGALMRPGSFISTAYESLREDVLAHPQYANLPIHDLRAQLDRLAENLEGPGSGLPDGMEFSPSSIGRFIELVKSEGASQRLRAVLGLGTQKSLLMLAAVVLIEGLSRQAEAHGWPFFMLIAAEEPEGHLHPNAQRMLMDRLMALSHQFVVSTHSPYIASIPGPESLRSMSRLHDVVEVHRLPGKMDPGDVRALKRLILRLRGEVLFARGLMFVEGVTEEQLIRGMFHARFGDDPSAFGITIVGVDGKSYAPFFLLALSLRKPFCVVSDNDGDTAHVVLKQLADVERKVEYGRRQNQSQVFFLSPGLAMEGELVYKLNLRNELIDALIACTHLTDPTPKNLRRQRERLIELSDRELKLRLEKKKSEYSGFLGDMILENPYRRRINQRLPKAVREAFRLMDGWIKDDGKTAAADVPLSQKAEDESAA